ncbi:low affinity iron permease family protein [Mucilaginibacter arboris]|uniref:Low affinity iron permease family protein n=1 Tax=Mucilaginibacter arboris TaxID=2682090 RepID=A0A7K1SSA4_9SPHI|nr:low affinity iron permease family protein [Mucilaginibacter arboris]MVN20199.1 low affinity iron permease family protein [Mucilaginibacter arboris]
MKFIKYYFSDSTRKDFWGAITTKVIKWTGSTAGIMTANGLMLLWLVYGYFKHYSENSQMILNTGTSIITFIMLFLIQKGQNKADKATQLKLDEIIYALETGNNKRLGIEKLTEEELDQIKEEYNLDEEDNDEAKEEEEIKKDEVKI